MDSLRRDNFRAWTKHHKQHNLMQLRRLALATDAMVVAHSRNFSAFVNE